MSDFEHEQFDDELGSALRRRAGGDSGSISGAHAAVLARSSHIRRRRAAVTGGVAMAAIIAGGFMLIPRGGDRSVRSDSGDDPIPGISTTVPDQTSADGDAADDSVTTTSPTTIPAIPSSTTAGVLPSSIAPQGNPSQSTPQTTLSPGNTSSVTTTPRNTTVTTGTSGSVVSTSSVPSTSNVASTGAPSTTSQPDVPPLQPFTKTYDSAYGSITVNWNGSALSLLTVSPIAGATAEIQDQETLKIRVLFVGGDESRIEIRVNNGELIEIIS